MSLFGIPICIPYADYLEFLNTNFPALILSDDGIFITYMMANGLYLFLIYLFIVFCYKFIIWIKNEVFG